jgi:nitrite reductase/ring-hydroxylating ferredoxin subunit
MDTTRVNTPAARDADGYTRVASLAELQRAGSLVVHGGRHGVALFYHEDEIYAVDNRCPHMGFPLSRGSVQCGILTCHWHHARFDLQTGGTFDPFADDVRVYPARVVGDDVYVDLRGGADDLRVHWKARLQDGLEQELSLIIIKSVLALLAAGVPPAEILTIGSRFGARYRSAGWGPGLTILTAMANILPELRPEDQPLALYHGLVHVARDCANQPPRFDLDPLPTAAVPVDRLKVWFRRFVEVRDSEGAERTLRTAIAAGAPPAAVADMLLAAATDHYFLAGGHSVDFINKAFELLELTGWQEAANVLPSLVGGICRGQRSEEQNAWRHPIDLVALLEPLFARLPDLVTAAHLAVTGNAAWDGFAALVPALLDDDPVASCAALEEALRAGATLTDLTQTLAYAAARRVARFHTSNEYGDWITVLHTLSYCNALDQSMRRAPSVELARGIFHGAMALYLDRFLNMPAARLPDAATLAALPGDGPTLLRALVDLFDREQQVQQAGAIVYRYLATDDAGGSIAGRSPLLQDGDNALALRATLGQLLLREDGEFHSFQMTEAGFRQYQALRAAGRPEAARLVLVAVARYLAAHSPTARAMLQTARTAIRLHRGEDIYEGEEE